MVLLPARWPVCWTSCTPPGSTSIRCGTSGSWSWTSASNCDSSNRTLRRWAVTRAWCQCKSGRYLRATEKSQTSLWWLHEDVIEESEQMCRKKGSLTRADLFCSCCCFTVNGPQWCCLVCLTALIRHPVGFYCEGHVMHWERVMSAVTSKPVDHTNCIWCFVIHAASLRHSIDLMRLTPKIRPEAET